MNGTDVIVYDTNKGTSRNVFKHTSLVTSLATSSTSSLLLTTGFDGVCNFTTDNTNVSFTPTYDTIWCSAFAPIGGVCCIGNNDSVIRVIDASKQRIFRAFVGHQAAITAVQFHPNCSIIGSCSSDTTARIWDVRTSESVRLFIGESKTSNSLAFSNNGQSIAFYDGFRRYCSYRMFISVKE